MSIRPLPLALLLTTALTACQHTPTAAPSTASPEVLLMGEVHDNAEGHAARAKLLREKIEAGWRPTIAMEQFDTDHQADLDSAMQTCADAACVIAKASPGKSSWTWDYYKPVIALALEYKLPLLAANLSRSEASKVVKNGFSAALSPELIARYQLDQLPAAVLAAQEKEVRDSHCGALPENFVSPMAKAQIARDVVMTETLRTHAANGIVLIAGNGHVRNDIAVPYWLQREGLPTHAIGFTEPGLGNAPFDDNHSIPVAKRADPCAGFKAPTGKPTSSKK